MKIVTVFSCLSVWTVLYTITGELQDYLLCCREKFVFMNKFASFQENMPVLSVHNAFLK